MKAHLWYLLFTFYFRVLLVAPCMFLALAMAYSPWYILGILMWILLAPLLEDLFNIIGAKMVDEDRKLHEKNK